METMVKTEALAAARWAGSDDAEFTAVRGPSLRCRSPTGRHRHRRFRAPVTRRTALGCSCCRGYPMSRGARKLQNRQVVRRLFDRGAGAADVALNLHQEPPRDCTDAVPERCPRAAPPVAEELPPSGWRPLAAPVLPGPSAADTSRRLPARGRAVR